MHFFVQNFRQFEACPQKRVLQSILAGRRWATAAVTPLKPA